MPYADPRKRQEAVRRYAETPNGKAAKARSRARYVARRREMALQSWQANAAPLAQVIQLWSRT